LRGFLPGEKRPVTIIWLIVAGLIVGALGRLVNPGRDPMGWLATLAIGVVSVLVVGLLLGDLGFWGYVLAIVVAAILVTIVGRLMPGDRDRRLTV
jgi:uncharacterized membrane protein YeaQ/YmgE (transglycosylase-associated protein family)